MYEVVNLIPNYLRRNYLLIAIAACLIAYLGIGAARAASVSHAVGSLLPRLVQILPAGVRDLQRTTIASGHDFVGCQRVVPSSSVQLDLSESVSTAAYVITAPGKYTGLNVNGTGCDIALYVLPGIKNVTISDSVIHDATRAGIVADKTRDTVLLGNAVYSIGHHVGIAYLPNGVQYGFGVLVESSTNATIANVSVSQYQKEGFLVLNSTGTVSYNTATGAGMEKYVPSNGFEIDGSDLHALQENRTELNQYTGQTYGAAGYIICGTSVQEALLTASSKAQFSNNWENLSALNDIPYFFSSHANCS